MKTDLPKIPTADHIAVAIVAAAREFGEDPIAVAAGSSGSRARPIAFHALQPFFPDVEMVRIVQFLGIADPKKAASQVRNYTNTAKYANWWNGRAVDRVKQAVVDFAAAQARRVVEVALAAPPAPERKQKSAKLRPTPRTKNVRDAGGERKAWAPAARRAAVAKGVAGINGTGPQRASKPPAKLDPLPKPPSSLPQPFKGAILPVTRPAFEPPIPDTAPPVARPSRPVSALAAKHAAEEAALAHVKPAPKRRGVDIGAELMGDPSLERSALAQRGGG